MFLVSWLCILALESTYLIGYEMPSALVVFLDFTKSAAPLLTDLYLLRGSMTRKGFLRRYIFGVRAGAAGYVPVIILFLLQFLTFYLFRPDQLTLTARGFLSVFMGQLLYGGGMEEGGWRGYLFPALNTKMPVLVSSALTSVVWTLWHLPYFIIPSSRQYGAGFWVYMLVTVLLGFSLSAVYMLTESVLLCTLFHAFTNTAVMTLQADMNSAALMLVNAAVSLGGAAVCQAVSGRRLRTAPAGNPEYL